MQTSQLSDLPHPDEHPHLTVTSYIAHPDKPDARLVQTPQTSDTSHPEEHPPTTSQVKQPSGSLSPDVNVKQPSHDPKEDENDERAVEREHRRRQYEESGGILVPPLVPDSPNMQAIGRSHLWGLWTDSVRLQRKIEFVRNAANFSLMETRVERFF